MKIVVEISKKFFLSECVKEKRIPRTELALGNVGMVEIIAPEYRRIAPNIDVRWSKAEGGRSYNLEPVFFPAVESDWEEIHFVVAVIAGTSTAIGSGRLPKPIRVDKGDRLVFGLAELETIMV